MTYANTLQKLEGLLESFLRRAVAAKEERLQVLGGINRLDDLARDSQSGGEIAQNLGDWFAEHNSWLSESRLRRADAVRISQLLGQIESGLSRGDELSPESGKIMSEIDRWHKSVAPLTQKLVLKRGPETAEVAVEETIADFGRALQRITSLFADYSGPRQHLLSVLTDSLRSAAEQKNEEALLLSALMIYYLKQYGYKIEPYVRKLKEAERTIKTGHRYAEPV